MTDSSCHEPGNGRPVCVQLDRIEADSARIDALEQGQGEIARDISGTRQIAAKTLDEVMALRGELRESEAKRDRTCDIRHKPVERRLDRLETHEDTRPTLSSLDYGEGEVTGVQSREELVARAKLSERAETDLTAQVAALTARLSERDRHSDRVRDDTRLASVNHTKIIVAIVSSGVGGAVVGALVRWLFGG